MIKIEFQTYRCANLLLFLQIENGDTGDTEELLGTEETDPGREKGDKTKKKKYLGRINYKVISKSE